VPISLSEPFGQLHHVLKHYKNEQQPGYLREGFINQVGALTARFLHAHRSCIEGLAGVPWDTITIVPSSSGRSGEHPLETALKRSRWLREQFAPLLKAGPVSVTHNQASDRGFAAQAECRDRSVLLVDDTYTSGARSQSAAAALALAGARLIAIVPVARIVQPDSGEARAELWRKARAKQFDFKYCCVGCHPLPPLREDAEGGF
jgi:hypothetical protein